MKVSKCINHERCEDLPSGLEIHGNSPSRCGYPRGYPSGCILYISCCIHGIPWCTKLPKKEESVIFCMHPLRPTGQRTLGAPGGTGDVGGLAAPWHDGEIEGLVSVQWGSSHFLMGIQWLQIDKPCIALLNYAELAEFERWKYAETQMHRHVHSPRLHISHWKRIQSLEDSKMDPFKLSEMAQSGANNVNWQTEMTRIRYTEAPGQPAFLEAASVLTALRHMCRNLKTLMMAVGLLEIQHLVIEMFENRVPLNPSLIIMFPMK